MVPCWCSSHRLSNIKFPRGLQRRADYQQDSPEHSLKAYIVAEFVKLTRRRLNSYWWSDPLFTPLCFFGTPEDIINRTHKLAEGSGSSSGPLQQWVSLWPTWWPGSWTYPRRRVYSPATTTAPGSSTLLSWRNGFITRFFFSSFSSEKQIQVKNFSLWEIF